MKQFLKNTIPIPLIVLLLLLTGGLRAQTINPDYIDGRAYLKLADSSTLSLDPYNNSIPALNLIFSTFGVDTTYKTFRTQDPLLDNIFTLEFTNLAGVNNLISQLELLPFVDYAERIPYMVTSEVNYTPNDVASPQWGLSKVQAEMAWDITRGDSNVVIAIVDNAFQLNHEDLVDNLWKNPGEIPGNLLDDDLNGYRDDVFGYDVADYDNNPSPPSGSTNTTSWVHGSHCAGIASASTDNGKGIAGLGFNCRIMAVKASFNFTDGSWVPRGFEGVDYAVSAGADVISMSWGGKGTSLTGERIIQVANNRGIVLVAAAGNSDEDVPHYPAAYNGVIAVGSTTETDARSGFSNYGNWVDVMAPGSNILSLLSHTSNDTYGFLSGTSMSTPLVAGLAGLVKSVQPALSPADVEQAIKDGCDDIDVLNPNYAGKLGAGRINAFQTLSSLTSIGSYYEADHVKISVYPNPFTDFICLEMEKPGRGEIQVTNVRGDEYLRMNLAPGTREHEINTRKWPEGTYVIRFSGEAGTISKVFVKP